MPLTTLHTPRLILRPPVLEDAKAIFAGYATDPEVARYVIWTPHQSIDETRRFLKQFLESGREDDNYPWIITLRAGTLVGAMHLRVTPPRAELGFNIARTHWNQGYGTEAVRKAIAFAFGLPGIQRVQAMCHVDNGASARVLEKGGMRREGVLRRYMSFPNVRGGGQDVMLFAVVAGDDRAAREQDAREGTRG